MCQHIQQKQNTWYYRRRVPEDVRTLHRHRTTGKVQTQLFFSLKTMDKREAARLADIETRRLDALWKHHREGGSVASPDVSLARLKAAGLSPGDGMRYSDLNPVYEFVDDIRGRFEPGEYRPQLSEQDQLTIDILNGKPVPKTLSDAKEMHFELGKGPKNKVGQDQFERAWGLLEDIAGNKRLDELSRADGNEYVQRLHQRGVGAETINRYLSQVRPVITTGIFEFELTCRNPFERLTIPNAGEGPRMARLPYSADQLCQIQDRCCEVDDPRRWLIAMLSDTGARLSEALGMEQADVFLNETIPFVWIRENKTRGLKTKQSDRRVPLVGQALWAVSRAMSSKGPDVAPCS